MNNIEIWIAVYVIINIIVFLMFIADKVRAKTKSWRISENALIVGALFGAIGATLGMWVGHHKVSKLKFKLVYVFLIIHLILIVLIAIGKI